MFLTLAFNVDLIVTLLEVSESGYGRVGVG